MVPWKNQCVALYRQYDTDQSVGVIAEVYDWCRKRWEYLIPHRSAEHGRSPACAYHA